MACPYCGADDVTGYVVVGDLRFRHGCRECGSAWSPLRSNEYRPERARKGRDDRIDALRYFMAGVTVGQAERRLATAGSFL